MDSERRQANQRTAARPKRKWRRSHDYVNARQRVRPVGWSWLSSSADVAPGNSGSPVVDRSGRLVGVAALSNSNVHTIAYQEDTSGNHAVSGAGIVALLETVYDARNLVKEIGAKPVKTLVAKNTPGAGNPAVPSAGTTQVETRYQPTPSNQGFVKRHKNLLPALIKALKDSDKEVVSAVTVALGNIGPDAIPALVDVLKSPDQTLRARAATALGSMGSVGQDAIPALVNALQDGEPAVRREAARAIGLIVLVPPWLQYSPGSYAPSPGPPGTP